MPASVVATSCRLTILSPKTRVDLAVPVDMPIGELVANVVHGLGPQVADDGIDAGGYVLQKLGERPLDPTRSLAQQGILDGAVLHLTPRSQQLPEVAYDDVLDAVGTGVRERTRRWTPDHTRRGLLGFGVAATTWAAVTAALSGPSWVGPCIVLGVAAALLLGVAWGLRRNLDNSAPAVVAAGIATGFAAVSAASGLSDGSFLRLGSMQLLPACGAAVLTAVLALLLLRAGTAVFTAIITVSSFGLVGAGAATINGLGPAGSAALTAGVALVVSPFAPLLAFRISRLTLPPLVTNAQELRADVGTVDGRAVLGQAALADHVLTGLAVGIAAAVGLSGVGLAATTDNTAARILAAVLAIVCLLRARVFGGVWQRIGFLSAPVAIGAALLWELGAETSDLTRLLALVAPVTAAGLLLLGLSALVPGRPITPTWGRAADILESLLVLSVIPLTLGVVGVYGAIRGLSNQ